jgi:hypothetical protein
MYTVHVNGSIIVVSPPGENGQRNKSIFSLAEITRLLKFPGITRIFLIKIISGLPSGEIQVPSTRNVR